MIDESAGEVWSYTNTSMGTARRCMREFELRYVLKLELETESREALQVGHAWHDAFDVQHKGGDPYAAIATRAPSLLWAEKLRRLFSAYAWYWEKQPLGLVESESTFGVEIDGRLYRGQMDGRPMVEGRLGLLERKTTGEDIGATADYWDRLRLDVQVGLYSVATTPLPDFILYDVARKPTIKPKDVTKADKERFRVELGKTGTASYFGETFGREVIERAIVEGNEGFELYGARLTSDIGDRPDFYFQRREVHRTKADYGALLEDLGAQVDSFEAARRTGRFPRNPDSCNAFGQCVFFALCSNNVHPRAGESAPQGFRVREHLHPELHANN